MFARKAALAFIFITVLLDMLALGIVIPVLPRLVESFTDNDTARAAEIFGVFGTVWALMQFFSMPVLGVLSDRYGRRPVILLACVGLGLDYILMALAPNLAWLLVGRIISGIAASNVSTSYAYVADVTPPKERAGAFGFIGVAFGCGFVLGPAVGGLLGSADPRLPFWVAAAMCLANALYGWFVLPESLPPERRSPFAWRKANPVGALALLRSQPQLLGLAATAFLMQLAHVVLPSVTVLYAGYRYGWNEAQVGFMLAAVGVCAMIVQGALVRPAVARLGERTALVVGLAGGAAGFALYGLAPSGALFLVGVPVMAIWGLASPSILALMTRRVSAQEQGRLQGANAGLQAIAGLIGPGLFTQIFATFIGARAAWHLPGAPFLLAALLLGAAMFVGARAAKP